MVVNKKEKTQGWCSLAALENTIVFLQVNYQTAKVIYKENRFLQHFIKSLSRLE